MWDCLEYDKAIQDFLYSSTFHQLEAPAHQDRLTGSKLLFVVTQTEELLFLLKYNLSTWHFRLYNNMPSKARQSELVSRQDSIYICLVDDMMLHWSKTSQN